MGDKIEQIKNLFKDFKQLDFKECPYPELVNVSTGNYYPPSYIVRIIFLGILGFKNFGRLDKVLWHTFFRYKDFTFMIRDYKFYSWTIESIREDSKTIQLVEDIKRKIFKASEILDKIIYNELKIEITKERFYLKNMYNQLLSIYQFYEDKVLATIENLQEAVAPENAHPKEDILDIIGEILTPVITKETLAKYSFALILSFFSLLEFLLDAMYLFQERNIKFLEFKKKPFVDRFKLTLPINENDELKHIYDSILNIKNHYRNPLAHGLTDEVVLLIPRTNIGLMPLSYKYISKETFHGFEMIDEDVVLEMTETFKKFLSYLSNREPYKFYMLYLSYGFPIPASQKEMSEIKKEMTTYENFNDSFTKKSSI